MKQLTEEDLKTLDINVLRFYHREAKDRLAGYILVGRTITERCYVLFGIYYAIASAAIGYVLSNLERQDDLPMTYGCLALFVFDFIALCKVGLTMKPHKEHMLGREIAELRIEEYVNFFQYSKKSDQEKIAISDELVMIERSIESQGAYNEKRLSQITFSLVFLASGSFLAAACFLATYLLVSI